MQIAKAYGAEVTAVDDSTKLDMLRSIGADRVVDYAQQDFTRSGERYDVILDIASTRSWADCRRALAADGSYVLIGHDHFGASNNRWIGSMGRFLKLLMLSPFDRRIPGVRSFKDPEGDPMAIVIGFIDSARSLPSSTVPTPCARSVRRSTTWKSGTAKGRSSSRSELGRHRRDDP